jgi:hypothetical protein
MDNQTERPNPFLIDDGNLASEWLKQPSLTYGAGVDEAEARHQQNMADAQLDVIAAQLRMKIRCDPEPYGFGAKPTVDDIKAIVLLQPEYQTALSNLNRAKYNLDIMQARVSAMLDRRKALERRVELLALNFHSEREPQPQSVASREWIENKRKRDARETDD